VHAVAHPKPWVPLSSPGAGAVSRLSGRELGAGGGGLTPAEWRLVVVV